jgi:Heavy metal binding domain
VKASLFARTLTLIVAPWAAWAAYISAAGYRAPEIVPSALAAAASPGPATPQATQQAPSIPTPDTETAYMCPMHPDYTSDNEGKCPRCGMNLVLATPFDMRDYRLEFQTVPPVVKAGEKIVLLFKVFHPGTGKPIQKFELVHDRLYHLFVISQDMKDFQHIHPEQRADGTWAIEVTLPRPGYYKVLSDFLPSGGSSQFIARPLVTAGYTGDLIASSAHLEPDGDLTKTVDDITAEVTYDPKRFVAGLYGHLTFHLSDAATGLPIKDLQTYLGAFGHTLIMSEDMVDYVHSHPIESIPPEANLEELRAGPDVLFEGLMPKPGHYRAWTQFRRHNKIYTFTNTFNVIDVGELSRR